MMITQANNDSCCICLDNLEPGDQVYGHTTHVNPANKIVDLIKMHPEFIEGSGALMHPMHTRCFKRLATSSEIKCPVCRQVGITKPLDTEADEVMSFRGWKNQLNSSCNNFPLFNKYFSDPRFYSIESEGLIDLLNNALQSKNTAQILHLMLPLPDASEESIRASAQDLVTKLKEVNQNPFPLLKEMLVKQWDAIALILINDSCFELPDEYSYLLRISIRNPDIYKAIKFHPTARKI